jgi:hypothetical protein
LRDRRVIRGSLLYTYNLIPVINPFGEVPSVTVRRIESISPTSLTTVLVSQDGRPYPSDMRANWPYSIQGDTLIFRTVPLRRVPPAR